MKDKNVFVNKYDVGYRVVCEAGNYNENDIRETGCHLAEHVKKSIMVEIRTPFR